MTAYQHISISTHDVAEALQGGTGKFEVTSPNGERCFVTRQPGHSIVSLEWAGSEPPTTPPHARSSSADRDGGSFQEISGCLVLLGDPKEQPGSESSRAFNFPRDRPGARGDLAKFTPARGVRFFRLRQAAKVGRHLCPLLIGPLSKRPASGRRSWQTDDSGSRLSLRHE